MKDQGERRDALMPTPKEEQETARVVIQLRGEPLVIRKIGDLYGPAMSITDPAEAAAYFDRLVEYHLAWANPPVSREVAEAIERQSLGYYAGHYYDAKVIRRVEQLYATAQYFYPETSVEDAFESGRRFAEGMAVARRRGT